MTDRDLSTATQGLAEADIRSERHVSRRAMLARLGLGVGATAAMLVGRSAPARAESDEEGRGRGCPLRDLDNGDQIRRSCGQTDND